MRSSRCVEHRLEDRAWGNKQQSRENLAGSRRTQKWERFNAHPIHTTLAESAPLCHDMGTRRTCTKTTTKEAHRGAETDSKRAKRSST